MIGHIQPGMGLGLPASKEIAFGLGTAFEAVIEVAAEAICIFYKEAIDRIFNRDSTCEVNL